MKRIWKTNNKHRLEKHLVRVMHLLRSGLNKDLGRWGKMTRAIQKSRRQPRHSEGIGGVLLRCPVESLDSLARQVEATTLQAMWKASTGDASKQSGRDFWWRPVRFRYWFGGCRRTRRYNDGSGEPCCEHRKRTTNTVAHALGPSLCAPRSHTTHLYGARVGTVWTRDFGPRIHPVLVWFWAGTVSCDEAHWQVWKHPSRLTKAPNAPHRFVAPRRNHRVATSASAVVPYQSTTPPRQALHVDTSPLSSTQDKPPTAMSPAAANSTPELTAAQAADYRRSLEASAIRRHLERHHSSTVSDRPNSNNTTAAGTTTDAGTTSGTAASTATESWDIANHPLSLSRYQREFQQVRLLASGGFGQVYHATHRMDGLDYAVKRVAFSATGVLQWECHTSGPRSAVPGSLPPSALCPILHLVAWTQLDDGTGNLPRRVASRPASGAWSATETSRRHSQHGERNGVQWIGLQALLIGRQLERRRQQLEQWREWVQWMDSKRWG